LEEELGEKRRIHSRLQTKVDEYEIAIKKMQQRFSNGIKSYIQQKEQKNNSIFSFFIYV
jgi:hypothetical protein